MPEQQTQREYWSGKVGQEWATHAARIDNMLAPLTGAALDAGAFRPGERVLDIGCGSGATSIEIARCVAPEGAVVGVDLSPQLLQVARERARATGVAAEFVEADAGTAKFDQPFDAAFSRFGVMFFDDPPGAFSHIRNAIRPGGRLAFVCWSPMAGNGWATVPISAIEPILKAPIQRPDPHAPGPYSLADPDKLNRILKEAGWRDIKLAEWRGDVAVGGGGSLADIAGFLLKIGPCARAIADQALNANEALQRLMDRLTPFYRDNKVSLSASCWIVTAAT